MNALFFHPVTLGVVRAPRPAPERPDGREGKTLRRYEAWQEGVRSRREYEPHPEARVFERFRQAASGGRSRLWVVLGEPGAGKTRLLEAWFGRWAGQAGPVRLGMAVPVLVRLRNVTPEQIALPAEALADRLWALGVPERARLDDAAADIYRPEAARLFRPVWLLDGLDEFPDALDASLFARLADLPGTKLLTCRSAVFQPHRAVAAPYQEQGAEYEILPLPAAQWGAFLRERLGDAARADALAHVIGRNAQLRELAGNPLMLDLIAQVCGDPDNGLTLPASRTAFYEMAVERWWSRRLPEQNQVILRAWRDPVLRALARLLALDRVETGLSDLTAAIAAEKAPVAIEVALQESGLLVIDRGLGRIRFPHLTFQEYFLAQALAPAGVSAAVTEHWHDQRYEETLALLLSLHAGSAGGTKEVATALQALVAWGRETHRRDPKVLWHIGRSPLRVALHLLRRAGVVAISEELVPLDSAPLSLLLALASDKNIPSELLRALADAPDSVGWNAHNTISMLGPSHVALGRIWDEEVSSYVDASDAMPPGTLAALARDPSIDVRARAAGNPATPPDSLAVLARDPDEDVRWIVAGNPATPAKILAALAHDSDELVRGCIAERPATPPEILASLAHDSDEAVRCYIAANPATPPDSLTVLARDPDSLVREHAASNPAMPPAILAALARGPDKNGRLGAARNLATPLDSLAALAHDSDELEPIEEFIIDLSFPVRGTSGFGYVSPCRDVLVAVAHNPSTTPEILAALIKEPDSLVFEAAASNVAILLEDCTRRFA
jgi:hypothetical protein